jgi:hypothetical protein
MSEQEEVTCSLCGKKTKEYCSTLACRGCHKAESLEDCLGNKQVNAMRAAYGIPPVTGSSA